MTSPLVNVLQYTITSDSRDFMADFGPWTPGTTTSGIQEMFNALLGNLNITTVVFKEGVYKLTGGFVNTSDSNFQAMINLPEITGLRKLKFIFLGASVYNYLGITDNPIGGVVLFANPESYPANVSPYPFIIYVNPGWSIESTGVVIFRNLSTSQQISCINLNGAQTYDLDGVICDLEPSYPTGAPASLPSGYTVEPQFSGVQTPPTATAAGINRIKFLMVSGYYQGIIVTSQCEISHYNANYVVYPIVRAASLHPATVHYINTNNCPYIIAFTNTNLNAGFLNVGMMDIQDNVNAGLWVTLVAHISVASGYVGPIGRATAFRNPQGANIPANSLLVISGSIGGFKLDYMFAVGSRIGTIAVPGSGTNFVNNTGVDLTFIVESVTSGSYVLIDLFGNDTPSIVLTAGSIGHIPAGWSIELTYSAMTWDVIGT